MNPILFLTSRMSNLPLWLSRVGTSSAVLITAMLVCVPATLPTEAQAAALCQASRSSDLPKILDFKMPAAGGLEGWQGAPAGTVFLDKKHAYDNRSSVRIERTPTSPSSFTFLTSCVRMDFTGKTIELRGFLRTQNVQGKASLWIREDGKGRQLALKNLPGRDLNGTTGWKQYSVSLPVEPQGRQVVFGVFLTGTGKAWVSGLQLLVDGKPIWEAPENKTVIDTDRQFDKGSGIVIKSLSRAQIANLVTLGKTWGFLKYYDPAVTSGHWQWDFELFRILPVVLAAPNRTSANQIILNWINGLGPIPHCNPCAQLNTKDLQLSPDLNWTNDPQLLGKALSTKLQEIYRNRLLNVNDQFYVALVPNAGNPIFEHERAYRSISFPDSGYQLLALYRYWNIIEYWYPDRNVIGENWDQVLAEFIPRLVMANDHIAYELQLMALIAMIHDSHANLWGSLKVRPPVGPCHIPVRLRFIQNQAVVTGYMDGANASNSQLQIGDVLTRLDGKEVPQLVTEWSPYYGDSNSAARLRDVASFMSRGPCGATVIGIRRDNREINLEIQRVPWMPTDLGSGTEVLTGPAFQLLSPQVAYLNPSLVHASQVADYIKRAAGTKGLIIDLRDYPLNNLQALGSLLISHVTPFVRFTVGNLSNPGAFYWTPALSLTPKPPHYEGKVVILVDAITQSHAEFESMAFRAVPGAMVVGSTTAGADGNVSLIPLPGGLHTYITGLGVFYPNGQPTQRVGIVPNVVVRPTIKDVRANRDVVLDKAVHLIQDKFSRK